MDADMFKLRHEHLDALREDIFAQPRLRISTALREKLPEAASSCSEEELQRLCEAGLERSYEYGLMTEDGAYLFAAATLLYGQDFVTNPELKWNRDFLTDDARGEEEKKFLLRLWIKLDTSRTI
jgi:hypothetical protein